MPHKQLTAQGDQGHHQTSPDTQPYGSFDDKAQQFVRTRRGHQLANLRPALLELKLPAIDRGVSCAGLLTQLIESIGQCTKQPLALLPRAIIGLAMELLDLT